MTASCRFLKQVDGKPERRKEVGNSVNSLVQRNFDQHGGCRVEEGKRKLQWMGFAMKKRSCRSLKEALKL